MSIIMGIESSCDETSVAILKDGNKVLSNIISSQIDVHKVYGGVVPEIASRKHLEAINIVIDQALNEAGVTLKDIDAQLLKGNKAAGTRARKSALELSKMMKEFRKLSVEASKN